MPNRAADFKATFTTEAIVAYALKALFHPLFTNPANISSPRPSPIDFFRVIAIGNIDHRILAVHPNHSIFVFTANANRQLVLLVQHASRKGFKFVGIDPT